MDGTATAQLQDKIDEIRGHLTETRESGWNLNEADTEHKVIDPLLSALGYGPFDIHKRGHDSVANNFPDYTLLPGKPQKWFLEVKKLDLPLQDGEAAQAVNYANNQGAAWAVLTNGRKWYIYNAHLPKPLTEKRVFQIDDLFGDASALKTLAMLSRSSMLADGLTEAWAFEQVQAIVRVQLETPNSPVRKQLRKIATEETKAAVSDTLIERALRSLSPTPPAVTANGTGPSPIPPPKPIVDLPPPGQALYTFAELAENKALGTGKEPTALRFSDGTTTGPTSWADAIAAAVEYVLRQFTLPPIPFTGRIKSRLYFLNTQPKHSTGQEMRSHRTAQMGNTKIYIDVHCDTQSKAQRMVALLSAVGAPQDAVKVSIR